MSKAAIVLCNKNLNEVSHLVKVFLLVEQKAEIFR